MQPHAYELLKGARSIPLSKHVKDVHHYPESRCKTLTTRKICRSQRGLEIISNLLDSIQDRHTVKPPKYSARLAPTFELKQSGFNHCGPEGIECKQPKNSPNQAFQPKEAIECTLRNTITDFIGTLQVATLLVEAGCSRSSLSAARTSKHLVSSRPVALQMLWI